MKSHKIWEDFFVKIGVDREMADEEACKIEHVVDPEITEKVDELVERINKYLEPHSY